MNALVNIAAILVFAFLVFAAVAVALRFLIPAEPYRPERPERSRSRRRVLADLVGTLAVLALVFLAVEVRFAHGAPFGDRGVPVVEVVEVGKCERPALGFGISRSCEVTAYRYIDSDREPWSPTIDVVTGNLLRPGDQVATYSASGWITFVFLGSNGSHWQPVSAEDRPNLVWLPTATLIAATALLGALRKRRTTRTRARRWSVPRKAARGTRVES